MTVIIKVGFAAGFAAVVAGLGLGRAHVGTPEAGTQLDTLAACVDDGARFRTGLQSVHEQQSNIGYAAAVGLRGQIVESIVAGMADLEHEVPVTRQSRFGVASVTKAVTGTAFLLLLEAGDVALDAPVQDYVPEFPERHNGTITPRQLLTHTSGIPHPQSVRTPDLYATHYDDVIDAIEVYRDVGLLFAPGARQRYSSSNYNLLAAVIQRASGTSFQEYVRESIFEPLGMTLTDFDDVRWVMPNRTRRYAYFDPWSYTSADRLHRIPGRWDYSFNMGGGNIISTAEDLVRFGQAFTSPGFFSAETLERIYTPIPADGVESTWSFGWFATTGDDGRRRISMRGANPGLQAGLVVYPDDELVVAVVANSWGHGARSAEMVNVSRFAALCMGWTGH
jgi:CubicO group peptidase (beta-lactamase class C family)